MVSYRQLVDHLHFAPAWAISLALLGATILVAVLLHRFAFRLATRLVRGRDLFWRSLVSRNRRPLRLAFVVAGLLLVQPLLPLTPEQAALFRQGIALASIVLVAWAAYTALHIWTVVYLRRFTLDSTDNLAARKHVTQTHILRRVATSLIVALAVSACLMTFDSVRQYGVSLLASAGAAGIIAGLALQPVLKNIFAGIQLAITQPIRIDDALLVEGEWGRVEEITSTYVVVKIWDLRRLILPLSYFIEKPFQNWTREEATLIGTVMINLDYTAPISAIRAKVGEIVAASPLWDRRVVNVQVTDFGTTTLQVRILATASDSGRAFDLRCDIREQLIAFLQAEHPYCLPRQRMELEDRRTERPSWAGRADTAS
ncbi:mechanosensitive ion channel family protein [Phreatobacter sp. AB_2022a]|uniref:mechanosensitive ion channel family protein n=1 Tax=Phreatobacter sp. AB_2022a TaxID=3003134 RepID=UPI0022870DED|nr:mechanosensitive ion channel family protein [Phreatobacter sp. AB_2022a]MCZ0733884.1 mechanosensitive ion channel family protein [Phreatobacter sp. AB_2022a]